MCIIQSNDIKEYRKMTYSQINQPKGWGFSRKLAEWMKKWDDKEKK